MRRIDEIKNMMEDNKMDYTAVKYLPNNPTGMKDFPKGWVYKIPGEKVWRLLGKNAEEAIRYIKNNTGEQDARL